MRRSLVLLFGCVVLLAACGQKEEHSAAVRSVHEFLEQVQRTSDSDNLDAFIDLFADDAGMYLENEPELIGKAAIRKYFETANGPNTKFKLVIQSGEVEVVGDLAYERGAFTYHVTSKGNGEVLRDVYERHFQILRRQPDGSWRTWRIMSNSALPASPPTA